MLARERWCDPTFISYHTKYQEPSELPNTWQGEINQKMPNSNVISYKGAPSTLTILPRISLSPSEQNGNPAGIIVQLRTSKKYQRVANTLWLTRDLNNAQAVKGESCRVFFPLLAYSTNGICSSLQIVSWTAATTTTTMKKKRTPTKTQTTKTTKMTMQKSTMRTKMSTARMTPSITTMRTPSCLESLKNSPASNKGHNKRTWSGENHQHRFQEAQHHHMAYQAHSMCIKDLHIVKY